MKALRPLVVGVALALTSPVVLFAQTAIAGDVFGDDPLVELLPVGPVAAGTTAEIRVLALDADGAPITGLELKATATQGTLGELKEAGAGLYALSYTAAATASAGTQKITLSGKTPSKVAVVAEATITITAPVTIEAQSSPSSIVLGKDATATLTASGAASSGVLVRTSAGTVGKPVRKGDNHTAQFTPPKVNFPQVALIAWVDAAEPDRRFGWQALPLNGSVGFPVKGPAGATVRLKVAGKEFGPVELDANGKGKVKIEVPPGTNEATQVTTEGANTTEAALALGIPATKRLGLFPMAPAVPADPTQRIAVRVAVATSSGDPDADASPALTVSAGSLSAVTHKGDGVYEAMLTPPAQPGSVTITAKLGDSKADVDELIVELVEALPESVTLAVTPWPLKGDTATLVLEGDKDALPVVSGASLGPVERSGNKVSAPLTKVDADAFSAYATLSTALSPNPVRYVVLVPDAPQVDDGGATGLLVATVDAYGLPVADQSVTLSIKGGSLPSKVTTGEDGTARVQITAGPPGMASIQATAGASEGFAAVVIGTGATVPAFPPAGPHGARWAATHPVLGGATKATGNSMASARRFIQVESEGEVGAGKVVPVTVLILDATGEPLVDLEPTVTASKGTLAPGPVRSPNGSLVYQLTLPDDLDGDVDVEVLEPDGAVGTLLIPFTPWGDAGEPKPAPTPAPPSSADEAERTWLRVRASGLVSSYRYEQTPSDDPGDLLPSTMSVGGDAGTAASPAGLELDGRLWFDQAKLPYLGLHASFRSSWYGIDADIFDVPATDQLVNAQFDLLGRFPFDTGSDRFWVGGKVGIHYDDFILFEGCLEPDCSLEYKAVGIPGLGLGPELGAEVGPLFLVAGYGFGLANFAQPYSHAFDIDVGVHIVPNLFVDLGFSSLSRTVELRGTESNLLRGELSDSQVMGKLGIGFAL